MAPGRGAQIAPDVRTAVVRRDGGCVGARLPDTCSGGLELHHLTNRSQGRDDSPENLICLCSGHHGWVTRNPEAATLRGFSIPGWVHDDPELWIIATDWAWTQRVYAIPGTPPWV